MVVEFNELILFKTDLQNESVKMHVGSFVMKSTFIPKST